MKSKIDTFENIVEIKDELVELNNLIDKKCLDIYNKNNNIENSISIYTSMMENLILEHHKICKNIYKK